MANSINLNNFTIKSQEAVQKANEIATSKQNQTVETSHILKAMLMNEKNGIPDLLRRLQVISLRLPQHSIEL